MCRRDIKVTEVLIAKGIVGSAPALSWIRKGQTKDILRYVSVLYEVTNYLPPHRRDYYRLAMFDVVARVASERVIGTGTRVIGTGTLIHSFITNR